MQRWKTDMMWKVQNLQLSHQMVARQLQDLLQNLEAQLHAQLKNCVSFLAALDSSCDIWILHSSFSGFILYPKTKRFMNKCLKFVGWKTVLMALTFFKLSKVWWKSLNWIWRSVSYHTLAWFYNLRKYTMLEKIYSEISWWGKQRAEIWGKT